MFRSILFISAILALTLPTGAQERKSKGMEMLRTGDAARGWEAVGRLDFGHGSFCTGALIAEDLVLTAAHCLFNKIDGTPVPISEMTFLAGWRDGRAEAYRGVRHAVPHPGFRGEPGEGVELDQVAVDVALLRLDRPIRSARIQPFSTTGGPDSGDTVGIVSYAQDRSEAPALQEVCEVMERSRGALMLSCAVDYGASGAPVFVVTDDEGPQIASVISAKAEADGAPVALAADLSRAIRKVRAEMERRPIGALNRGTLRLSSGTGSGSGSAKFVKP